MRLFIFAMLFAIASTAPAAMYKWVDGQGRVQYSDVPPPPGVKSVEEHKVIRNTISTAGSPFAVQDAAQRNPITLWMHDCGDLCNQARNYLASRGVPYTLRNPTRMSEQDAWKKASTGENAVPLLIIGTSRTLKGFQESEWSAALDAAGYPRGAPALKPQAIPPSSDPVAQEQRKPGPQPTSAGTGQDTAQAQAPAGTGK